MQILNNSKTYLLELTLRVPKSRLQSFKWFVKYRYRYTLLSYFIVFYHTARAELIYRLPGNHNLIWFLFPELQCIYLLGNIFSTFRIQRSLQPPEQSHLEVMREVLLLPPCSDGIILKRRTIRCYG